MSSVPWSNETERADYYKKLYNEQLAICDRIEKEIERKDRQIEVLVSFQRFCETEAVKEFADRLKESVTYIPWCDYPPVQRCIDDAVKEMVGED